MPGQTTTLKLPYPTPDDTVDVPRDVQALANAIDPIGYVPIGCMMLWPTSVAPLNWLLCQGQQVDGSAWPRLAQLLGVDGNGKITLPDLSGKFPLGPNASHALGSTGGVESVALATGQLPAHAHTGTIASNGSHTHTAGTDTQLVVPPGGYVVPYAGNVIDSLSGTAGTLHVPGTSLGIAWAGTQGSHAHTVIVNAAGAHVHGVTIDNTGGGATHENMPPYVTVNYIIRAG